MELTVVVAFTSLVVSIISSIYGFTQNKKLQEFEHWTREDTKEELVLLTPHSNPSLPSLPTAAT